MSKISPEDYGDLERYLEEKALGGVLLADFLADRVFSSAPSGRKASTPITTEESTDA